MNEKMITLENVDLWRDGRMLLSDVNWRVTRGEHWVVLGRNGAGKTLLLKILAGYLWPSRGRVSVLGERFGGVDLRELRQDIGWVSAALAEKIPSWDSALDVVISGWFATFGLYQEVPPDLRKRALELMDEMGLSALVGQKFVNLSAGERQRVLLARSRLPQPRLLILDEPCSGLDLAAREKLLAQVSNMAKDPEGPTMLMVTHRVSEIMPCFTHGLLLHRSRILAQGPVSEVLTGDLLSQTLEFPLTVQRVNGRWRETV